MEKQLERRREPEPVIYERNREEDWVERRAELKKVGSLPHVLRYESVSWKQNAQAFLKRYVDTRHDKRFSLAPIYSMDVLEQIIAPGHKSGKHRHFPEAVFFILDGEGYEIHDEVNYPWKTGDLMCVPTYCVHQHFNPTKGPARLFFAVPGIFRPIGLFFVEQIELHQNYVLPEGSTPLYGPQGEFLGFRSAEGEDILIGKVDADFQKVMSTKMGSASRRRGKDTYSKFLTALRDESEWRRQTPHVIRAEECPWEDTPMGRIRYFASPFARSPVYLFDVFVQEIPPGGRSGKHRHVGEEVHKILKGRGYDVHDGKRWDWQEEDVVSIPINTVHQHFNADPRHPATFVSFQSRVYHHIGHGGIEHLEDAPEYR